MQLRIQGVLLFFVIVLFGFSRSLESIVFEQDHYNIEYNLKLRPLEVDSSQQIWLQPKKMAKSLLQLYLWWYTYTGLWLKNSLLAKIFNEPVIFFHERPGTKFLFPAFCNTLNAWLPSFVFIRWWMQNMEREHAKHLLKRRFYFNYLFDWHQQNA